MIVGAPEEALCTATAASARECAAGAGDSLVTECTGTILVPRQMSPIAGDVLWKKNMCERFVYEGELAKPYF